MRFPRTLARSPWGFAMLCCAPSVSAQLGETYVLGDGLPPTRTFGASAVVDLDGDGYPEFVGLREHELDVTFAPSMFELRRLGVLSNGNDLVALPAALPDAGVVAVATDADVGLLTWNGSAFVYRPLATQPARFVAREVTLPGAPRRLLAVLTDQRTVLRLSEVGGATPWQVETLTVCDVDVLDVASADLDGDGGAEVCLLVANGVRVHADDGVLLDAHTANGTAQAFTKIRDAQGGKDWLALFMTDHLTPPSQYCLVAGEAGIVHFQALGDVGVRAVAAADTGAGADGVDDLTISYTYAEDIPQIAAETGGGMPVFDLWAPGTVSVIPYGQGAAPDNEAQPGLGDLDGDGDVDTLLKMQSNGGDFVYLNPNVDEDACRPMIVDHTGTFQLQTAEPGAPLIALSIDVEVNPTACPGATHAEVLTYRRASPAADLEIEPVFATLRPLGGGGTLPFEVTLEEASGDSTDFDSIYFLFLRLVTLENGDVTHRFPTRMFVIEGDLDDSANQDYVAAVGSGDHPLYLVHPNSPEFLGNLGSIGDEVDCLPPPYQGGKPPLPGGG